MRVDVHKACTSPFQLTRGGPVIGMETGTLLAGGIPESPPTAPSDIMELPSPCTAVLCCTKTEGAPLLNGIPPIEDTTVGGGIDPAMGPTELLAEGLNILSGAEAPNG